jgi:hypothetical protein
MTELLPCPFCGVRLDWHDEDGGFAVHPLNGCRESGHQLEDAWEQDAWNRRAAPEAPSDAWRPTHLHYKGDEYQKLFDALHTETCEQMTIYRSKAGQVYARPKTMFEQRLADGRLRFEPLRPDGQTGGK